VLEKVDYVEVLSDNLGRS